MQTREPHITSANEGYSVAELMRLHVETLFTCDDAGRLLTGNYAGAGPAPRFFFGRTAQGNACWFRHDVEAALVNELRALCEAQPLGLDVEPRAGIADAFIACLSRAHPIHKTEMGPAFHFPADVPAGDNVVRVTHENAAVLSPYLTEWHSDISAGIPMFVALEDGKGVSICGSVRVAPQAHEAGVETHRDFRRRGHAERAVREWARTVRAMDRIPLYSTSWKNEPSRALARKLGLIQYGATLHIT